MIPIEDVLPHREPFLFVDKIDEYEYMKKAIGSREIPETEFWARGHFPGKPIFPGVLILEIMAQVGGFIFVDETGNMPGKKFAYLTRVNNFKLKNKVVPGDVVSVSATFLDYFTKYARIHAEAYVANKKVAEAEIIYTFLEEL